MFSPLPPVPNGISDYTYELLELLSRQITCVVVVDDLINSVRAPNGVAVLPLADYELSETKFVDALHVYQIGNNPDHLYMLPVLARHPGLIVLHDPSLHHLLDCATLARGDFDTYSGALEHEYGAPGKILGDQFRSHQLREQSMFFDLPMIGGLVGPAFGVIVHSLYAAAKVIARVPTAAVTVVPHQYSPPAIDRALPRAEVRRQLGVDEDHTLFISLGFVTKSKRIPDTLRALARIKNDLPPFRYVIAGELRPEEVDVASLVSSLGLDDVVVLLGYVEEANFFSLIAASDVVINLRYPIGGETSGSMIRALGGGACIVVVDKGPFGELPDEVACKLRWGPGFENRLGDLLLQLAHDRVKRTSIGHAASRFIAANHSLEATVAGYMEAIRAVAGRTANPWQSAVEWETLPPFEFARLMQDAPRPYAGSWLPLWFRAGAVLTCESPCCAASWGGGKREGELLNHLGHQPKAATLGDLFDGNAERDAPRTLDLAVVFATAGELLEDCQFLGTLNHALAFGGLLIVNIESNASGPPHPLQTRDEGTRVFEAFGFRVDAVAVVAPPNLDAAPPAPAVHLDERCWRAVKVSEFFVQKSFAACSGIGLPGA